MRSSCLFLDEGIFQWFFEIFSNGHPLYSLHGLNLVHACNYLKASKNGRPKTLEEIEAYRPRNYIGPLIISKVGDRLLVWPSQLQDLTFENDDTLMYLVPFVQAGFTEVKRIQSLFVRIGLTGIHTNTSLCPLNSILLPPPIPLSRSSLLSLFFLFSECFFIGGRYFTPILTSSP